MTNEGGVNVDADTAGRPEMDRQPAPVRPSRMGTRGNPLPDTQIDQEAATGESEEQPPLDSQISDTDLVNWADEMDDHDHRKARKEQKKAQKKEKDQDAKREARALAKQAKERGEKPPRPCRVCWGSCWSEGCQNATDEQRAEATKKEKKKGKKKVIEQDTEVSKHKEIIEIDEDKDMEGEDPD